MTTTAATPSTTVTTAAPALAASSPQAAAYPLAARARRPEGTVVTVRGVEIGGNGIVVMAGPCAVEHADQVIESALAVQRAGATILRGGAFKPRTSPYSFRGLGRAGLELLAEAGRITGLPIVTEVMSEDDVDLVTQYADILQIGARNMSNFNLLEAAADSGSPVLLKRGMAAGIKEWLLAAEYILARGNEQVILCERGVRGFDAEYVRNTFDLNAVAVAKLETHLPVIADPSHAVGRRDIVPVMARAAVAAGADGIIIEVHPEPEKALCDGPQSVTPRQFAAMMTSLHAVAVACGRSVPGISLEPWQD